MDEILKTTLLYDFYGELLTERQRTIFEMFHLNDLSLTEIGQELDISRQAVKDQMKRIIKNLGDYEEKLKLVEKFLEQKALIKKIKALAEEIEGQFDVKTEVVEKIEQIKKISDDILE
jgi:Uncharacterized protein conserved in bacteria